MSHGKLMGAGGGARGEKRREEEGGVGVGVGGGGVKLAACLVLEEHFLFFVFSSPGKRNDRRRENVFTVLCADNFRGYL